MPKERVYTVPNPDGSFVTFDIGWNSEHGGVSLGVSKYIAYDDNTPDTPYEYVCGNELTYKQINALIKNLRKARDGAFGKPE